jgi:hypothetical protein
MNTITVYNSYNYNLTTNGMVICSTITNYFEAYTVAQSLSTCPFYDYVCLEGVDKVVWFDDGGEIESPYLK